MIEASPRGPARRRKNSLFRLLCIVSSLVAVSLLVVFLGKIVQDGLPRLSLSFITDGLSGRAARTGIWEAVVGSFYVMILTALISVPVGVSAAIYLEEFTPRKTPVIRFIQLNIANLAGVPSIVYGLLGLAVFVRFMHLEYSLLAGALTMSLLVLPFVIIVTQEALRAVPKSYREGALALGSTRWQAIRLQVLPAALPGILTGIILSMSRAVGETAPLIAVGAASKLTQPPRSIMDQYTVLPVKIFDWALEARQEFHAAAATAILVLMIFLVGLNSIAIYLRARSRAKLR